MKTRLPTSQEIQELVSFLPRLYADGFTSIRRWGGGTKGEDGVIAIPWPEYDEVVEEFFRVASAENWSDNNYSPEDASRMIENNDFIKTADLAKIKTMLTFCVRGERFCDGHWGAMIDGGYIRRLLQRLAELGSENA
jgi:hypothetical protein